MRYNKLNELMLAMWQSAMESGEDQQTVCLLGSPGIGKSSQGVTLAKRITDVVKANPRLVYGDKIPDKIPPAICRVLDLSSMLPEDLNGLPFRDGSTTKFCAHTWLHEISQPNAYGVLVLDDLPAAAPMMQVAARQCSLERRIHDHRLAPGMFVIVTGNRREDKSAASTLPAHFRNSVCLLDVDLDIDEWAIWYGLSDNRHPVVPAFLRWKESLFSKLPADADTRGAFATPRTWTKLGTQYVVAEKTGTLLNVAEGLVGSAAVEFCAFVKTRSELVDPHKVYDDPEKALPDPEKVLHSPDRNVAMMTGIAEVASREWKNAKPKDKVPAKFLRAVAWASSHNREYCGAAVSTYISNGGSLPDLVRVARDQRKEPGIGPLLVFLKSALIGGN
ncbi:MAG: hypothetical protein MN733_02930 [Nitrososphaera sp.]|nr:hypothetical protein [Nitrososphaera sp.]